MLQLCVDKQGRSVRSSYSNRIFTADTVNHFVFLSKKGHPEQMGYHKMRLTQVTLWPYVSVDDLSEPLGSTEAQLTIRLDGYQAEISKEDRENFADMQRTPPTQVVPLQHARVLESLAIFWILRCETISALEELVSVFYQMNAVALRNTPSARTPQSTREGESMVSQGSTPSAMAIANRDAMTQNGVDFTIVKIKGNVDGIKKKSAHIGNSAVKQERHEFH